MADEEANVSSPIKADLGDQLATRCPRRYNTSNKIYKGKRGVENSCNVAVWLNSNYVMVPGRYIKKVAVWQAYLQHMQGQEGGSVRRVGLVITLQNVFPEVEVVSKHGFRYYKNLQARGQDILYIKPEQLYWELLQALHPSMCHHGWTPVIDPQASHVSWTMATGMVSDVPVSRVLTVNSDLNWKLTIGVHTVYDLELGVGANLKTVLDLDNILFVSSKLPLCHGFPVKGAFESKAANGEVLGRTEKWDEGGGDNGERELIHRSVQCPLVCKLSSHHAICLCCVEIQNMVKREDMADLSTGSATPQPELEDKVEEICKLPPKKRGRKKGTPTRMKEANPPTVFIHKKFKCSECKYSTNRPKYFRVHVAGHTDIRDYACDQCDYRASRPETLSHHKLRHTDQHRFHCELCDFKTKYHTSLSGHMKLHDSERPLKCLQCNFSTKHRVSLTSHLLTHSNAKPLACDLCDFRTKHAVSLKMHKRVHANYRPYKCDQCDFVSTCQSNLKQHLHKHSEERSYSCEHCDGTFKSSNALKHHIMTHLGLKPHACTICNKRFLQISNMKRHLVTHTKEKRAHCKICDKYFTLPENLKRHDKLFHSEVVIKVNCTQCDKVLCSQSSLDRHIATVHKKQRNFVCVVCGSAYSANSTLQRHLKSHTEEEIELESRAEKEKATVANTLTMEDFKVLPAGRPALQPSSLPAPETEQSQRSQRSGHRQKTVTRRAPTKKKLANIANKLLAYTGKGPKPLGKKRGRPPRRVLSPPPVVAEESEPPSPSVPESEPPSPCSPTVCDAEIPGPSLIPSGGIPEPKSVKIPKKRGRPKMVRPKMSDGQTDLGKNKSGQTAGKVPKKHEMVRPLDRVEPPVPYVPTEAILSLWKGVAQNPVCSSGASKTLTTRVLVPKKHGRPRKSEHPPTPQGTKQNVAVPPSDSSLQTTSKQEFSSSVTVSPVVQKKRGRPKKISTDLQSSTALDNSVMTGTPLMQKKQLCRMSSTTALANNSLATGMPLTSKKCGRPKKSTSGRQGDAVSLSTGSMPLMPKKRGRPKKVVSGTEPEALSTVSKARKLQNMMRVKLSPGKVARKPVMTVGSAVKKRRGRPPKQQQQQQQQQQVFLEQPCAPVKEEYGLSEEEEEEMPVEEAPRDLIVVMQGKAANMSDICLVSAVSMEPDYQNDVAMEMQHVIIESHPMEEPNPAMIYVGGDPEVVTMVAQSPGTHKPVVMKSESAVNLPVAMDTVPGSHSVITGDQWSQIQAQQNSFVHIVEPVVEEEEEVNSAEEGVVYSEEEVACKAEPPALDLPPVFVEIESIEEVSEGITEHVQS